MKKNKSYSANIIAEHLENQIKSSLSKASYCKLNSIHPSTFQTWQKKQDIKASSNSKFIDLELPTPEQTLTIAIKNKFKLEVSDNINSNKLSSIIESLKGLL